MADAVAIEREPAPAESHPRAGTGARVIRVAHAAARLPVGGMENVVASLVRGLPEAQYSTRIWCLEEADDLGRELRREGRELIEFGRSRRRDLSLIGRLASRLRSDAVDVLHCHDELSWFYGTLAAAAVPRARVVVTMHGRRGDISPRHRLEQRLLARGTRAIVAVSTFLRQQLIDELGLSPDRVTLVMNGVRIGPVDRDPAPARRALGLPTDARVIGCVGELSPVKHFDLAIDAFARIAAFHGDARLLFVGDGACRPALEEQARALGVSDRVHFAGVRRDVPSLWPAFDVYLCSSRYEGTSLSILEAMAAGRAVVATAVGGNPALIGDRDTGRLVPADDAPALAGVLAELLDDSRQRQALGTAAHASAVAKYGLDATLAAYQRVYRTILGGIGARTS
jgi:glycosyltransferase involved in cell wall biosynthesis